MGKSKKGSTGAVLYLLAYNFACCLGWLGVLILCLKNIAAQSTQNIWNDVEILLKIVQTAACLEVIHSMVGIVKSPWTVTFMQVFSRVWTVWAIMNISPDAQTSIFMALACTSWALVEVPRYLFYAMSLLDNVPYPLFWLRYSLFAVLYPTGITGELGCMYYAAMTLYGDGLSTMTTGAKVLLGFIILVIVTYVPGSPKMYGHMMKARRKQFFLYQEKVDEEKKK